MVSSISHSAVDCQSKCPYRSLSRFAMITCTGFSKGHVRGRARLSITGHRRKTRSRPGTSRRTTREHSAPKREEYRSERLVQKGKYWTKPAARRDIRATMPPICRTARSAIASRKGAEGPSNLSGAPKRSRGASRYTVLDKPATSPRFSPVHFLFDKPGKPRANFAAPPRKKAETESRGRLNGLNGAVERLACAA